MKFLRYPIPFDDESLLSYIYRLSHLNACPVEWILKELKYNHIKYKNKINSITDDKHLKMISQAISLNYDDVYNLTYNRYYSDHMSNTRNDAIRREHFHINDIISLKTSKYCPLCLNEEFNHKLHWDFKLSKICLKHKTYLVDTCDCCGGSLSVENIVTGMCSCNRHLKDITPNFCNDNIILNIQIEIFNNFGITLRNKKFYNVGYVDIEYIKSVHTLTHLLLTKKGKLKRLEKLYKKSDGYKGDIYAFYLLYNIKLNLSKGLNLLLDDLNDIMNIELSNDTDDTELHSNSNPLSILTHCFYSLEYFLNQYDILYDYINKYLNDNYTYSFFKTRINRIIVKERYINITDTMKIFNLSMDTLKSTLNVYKINNGIFFDLEQTINFVYKYIKRYKIGKRDFYYKEYTTIKELYDIFDNFKFSELEIMNIIVQSEIDVILNLFRYSSGIDILLIEKKIIYPILLKKALEKLENS